MSCATWNLRAEQFAFENTAQPRALSPVVAFQRWLCTDHATLSFVRALKTARWRSIATTICTRRLFITAGLGTAEQGAIAQSSYVRDEGCRRSRELVDSSRPGIDAGLGTAEQGAIAQSSYVRDEDCRRSRELVDSSRPGIDAWWKTLGSYDPMKEKRKPPL